MDIEPTGGRERRGRRKPMVLSSNQPAATCPCGEERIDDLGEDHAIGPNCRGLVVAHVRRRFGPHRYGGRVAHHVNDIVQDCFVKLLVPGGLDSFRPPPDRPLVIAFRAWLYAVVRYHCHNQLKQLGHDPIHNSCQPNPTDGQSDSSTGALGGAFEPIDTVSPDVAFARDWLRCLAECAAADVEARWRAQRKEGAERFRVLLPIALGVNGSYRSASKELGISCTNARVLAHGLRDDLATAVRNRVADELRLEPGLSEECIEASVDAAISEHFEAAYPGGRGLPPDLFLWKTKSEPTDSAQPKDAESLPEQDDTPPESKP